MCWERARKPEQKAMRREAILNAAKALFSQHEYEQISLNGIARQAGISKPNIYRYFATREEIFLAIFEEQWGSFLQSLMSRLKRIRAKDPVPQICRAWVQVALEHRTLLELLPHLMTSLEKNSSVEQIVQFKKKGFALMNDLVQALADAYPKLVVEQWGTVVQSGIALMAGLWPMTNPGENVNEAFERLDMEDSIWKFEPLMKMGLEAVIRGTTLQERKD